MDAHASGLPPPESRRPRPITNAAPSSNARHQHEISASSDGAQRARQLALQFDQRTPRLMHTASPTITGSNYRSSCGSCGMPPWQACACSPLLEVGAG